MQSKNKVAIVTGGGNGIGKATVKRFAEEGTNVVVADVDIKAAEQIAQQVTTDTLPIKCDISDKADVEQMIKACIDEFESIDVLVNNAGTRAYGPVTEADENSWDRILSVNLKGAAFCSKHAIPKMKETGGSIVNVSSVHAYLGRPEMVQYDTTKAGLTGLTRSMACDHADDNIRVNAILPGATLTEFHVEKRGYDEEFLKPHSDGPGVLNRWAEPEEIANGILFLSSDEASYITGECLQVDGGVRFVENI
jgi:NAD(P)-dependent dehydrogenase (short-subunit alcohol dehydrogenase family)